MRFMVPIIFLFSMICLGGCMALDEALYQTTGGIQQRDGDSPYYQNQGGDTVDAFSGYQRVQGQVTYYNKTGIPVFMAGKLIPVDGSYSTQWYARMDAPVDPATPEGYRDPNKEPLYFVESGPHKHGRIIILLRDHYEER